MPTSMRRSRQPVLVGLDLGTTVCRSLVFDQHLRPLGSARCDLRLFTRSGAEVEQDAECWWGAACQVVGDSIREADCLPSQVAGISISSQGLSFVPVDGNGRPIRMALSWLDTRAAIQSRRVLETIGETTVFAITGKPCREAYVLPKLLWMRESEPEVFRKCRRILMPLDFLTARLTGEYVTDHTMASGTMLYDLARQAWSADILGAFELDDRMLPQIRWSGTPVGQLRPEAAEALRLPRHVVVSVGGQDQKVAALGAGITLENCMISLGTAMAITRKCNHLPIDERMRIPCFSDLFPSRWVLEGYSLGCAVLDWARRNLFAGMSYEDMDRLADEAAQVSNPAFFLPFFSAQATLFPDARLRGTLCNLDLSTGPGQIARSILEGIAFVIRANLSVIEDLDRSVRELRIFGGGSRSDVWCQIIADVVRRPVHATGISECGSLGAAILAGAGSTVFESAEKAGRSVATRTSYEPREQNSDRYDGMYAEFSSLARRFQQDVISGSR